MNAIDDTYKQETEDLDNKFVDNHNLGRTKKSTINSYLSGMKKSRNKFNKGYSKYNKKEKWKIAHPKKKKKKREKQKYLEIKHFNFKHNFFEKLTMRLNVIFFNINRFFSKIFAKIIPRILFYIFYKLVKTIRAFFRDADYFVNNKKSRMLSNIKRWFKNLIQKIKNKIKKLKEYTSKIMSKFGKREKKEGDDNKKGESDNDDKKEKGKS